MGTYTLPELPYKYDALEPYIDAKTMEIHHTKHHQTYIDKLNAAIEGTEMEAESIESLFSRVSELPKAVRNHGGGYWNHAFFWESLHPNASKEPSGTLATAIMQGWGSFEEFKQEFSKHATTLFGSGWTWLALENGQLVIFNTPNQDNPLMDVVERDATPLLGLDMWEHAYYLKHQNRKAEYVENFFQIINWDKVAERFDTAQ